MNRNGAQPEAYSTVEPYYSEFSRMLRIPCSPPSTKEKIKWAESHLESLSLTKTGQDNSSRIPIPNRLPTPSQAQNDIEMQVDQETAMYPSMSVSTFKAVDSAGLGIESGFREGQVTSGMEVDSMDVDVVDGGDGFGRKRKADGDVDDAPPCKRK